MPEPSIQDITNIAVDPERATGNPGVVYDSRELIRTLNQAGQQKAENDWRKYNMFMGNLKEVYKDLNEIAKQPVLTEDREKLKQTMADIVKGISSDPKGFFGGGAKYQETLGKLTQLQTETTESKQNNLYDAAHRQYFYANPELDTPENRSVVDNYRKGQLGSRSPYMLKLPGIFDPKVLSDQLKISSMTDTTTEAEDGAGHTKKIVTQEVDPAVWEKNAKGFYYSADKRGNPVIETVKKQYEQLPASVKTKYSNSADPVFDYYIDLLSPYKPMPKVAQTLETDQPWITKQNNATQIKTTGMNNATTLEANKRSIKAQMVAQGYVPFDPKNPVDIYDPILGMTRKAKETDAIKDPNFHELYVPGSKLQSTTLLNTAKASKEQKAATLGANSPLATDDYWADHIENQFGKITTQYKVAPNFTGDIDIKKKDISGADVALWDNVEQGSKNNTIDEISIRYENGKPVGLIINGQFYNSTDINSKANEKAIHLMGSREPNPYRTQ